jgi:small subunit ribosomal protein S16
MTNPNTINIDAELAKKWLANGAQPTDTVKVLLKKIDVIK